jgi:hypothetical protein
VNDLTAAGWIVARFGADAPYSPPSVSVTSATTAFAGAATAGANLLLVGTPLANPSIGTVAIRGPVQVRRGLWRDGGGTVLPSSTGVVLEARNPKDATRAVLIASGNGPEGVQRAAQALAGATMRQFLTGAFTLITTPPVVLAPPSLPNTVALHDLGYSTITLQGTGVLGWHFNFDLQGSPRQDGAFTLDFGHGMRPAGVASSVSVSVNGQLVATRTLSNNDPVLVSWRVPLTADVLHAGTNTLNVNFFLAPSVEGCVQATNPGLWATIDSSSTLTRPPATSSDTAGLRGLPYPLLQNGNPDLTIIVTPDSLASDPGVLNLAVVLGTQSRVDTPGFTVMTAAQATPRLLGGHTVVLDGLPGTNSLLTHLQGSLPLRATADGRLVGESGVFAHVMATEQAGFGLVEAIRSPWDSTQTAIVVSGSQSKGLAVARQSLTAGSLSGSAAIVDLSGAARSVDTSMPVQLSQTTATASKPIQVLALGGLALALVQVLVSIWRGISKKNVRR